MIAYTNYSTVQFYNLDKLITNFSLTYELDAKQTMRVRDLLIEFMGNQKIRGYYFIVDEEEYTDYLSHCLESDLDLWRKFNLYLTINTGYINEEDEYEYKYILIEK